MNQHQQRTIAGYAKAHGLIAEWIAFGKPPALHSGERREKVCLPWQACPKHAERFFVAFLARLPQKLTFDTSLF
jgi:hypothetical protein